MQAKEKLLLAIEALLKKGADIQSAEMRFAIEIAAPVSHIWYFKGIKSEAKRS